MTVVAVDSIRNLPSIALLGSHLLASYCAAALIFLVPVACILCLLTRHLPQACGIYHWTRELLNEKLGIYAIWLQWANNLIWYPAVLSFIIATLSYFFSSHLMDNSVFVAFSTLSVFWALTGINLLGLNISSRFSTLCTIFGLILPLALIIIMGISWFISHPDLHLTWWPPQPLRWHEHHQWVGVTALILSFCGLEVATVHAQEVENPRQSFPSVLSIAAIFIFITLLAGSLAIASIVPSHELNLIGGIMQTMDKVFSRVHYRWALEVFSIPVALGVLGGLLNWIIAPTKGIWLSAKEGHWPKAFTKTNRHGAPYVLLLLQASIVSFFSLLFIFFPSINETYWLFTSSAVQLNILMYFLIFISAWRLIVRLKHDYTLVRRLGWYAILSLGLAGLFITFYLSFYPPELITQAPSTYQIMLTCILAMTSIVPFIYPLLQRWKQSR